MKKQNSSLQQMRRLAGEMKEQAAQVFAAVLCAVVSGVSAVVATLYLGQGIDILAEGADMDFGLLVQKLVILLVLYLASALFAWLVGILSNNIAYLAAKNLRNKAFEKLGRLPIAFFDASATGDIISRFVSDAESVSDALALALASLLTGIVTIVVSLVIMLSLNAGITLVVLLCVPLVFITAYFLSKFSNSSFLRQQETVGDISGFVSEIVGNQKQVKAFGYENQSKVRFEVLNADLFTTAKRAYFLAAIFNPTTRFTNHISYLLVGLVGGMLAITQGVSVGVISSFLVYSSQFAKPFNEISGILGNIQQGFASLQRMFDLLDEKEEIRSPDGTPNFVAGAGEVEFQNVSFAYDPSRPLISNFSLKAESGCTIAIVGPTGAGKTTLVNLIMRFYELDKGKILVDGQDIAKVTRSSLRRNFGMVLQDTWLFNGSVAENIAYAKPGASREDVIAAAKSAHAHSFIKRLPQQYDTFIEHGGEGLSQGERQLLTIARAMLAAPPMLILDEATSSIDTLTEIRIQKAFAKLMRGRTSFVIAHRLSTITAANLILVLDKGNIIESGNHYELLQKDGFYASLYRSQFE